MILSNTNKRLNLEDTTQVQYSHLKQLVNLPLLLISSLIINSKKIALKASEAQGDISMPYKTKNIQVDCELTGYST